MKLLIASILAFSLPAMARTQSIFSADGGKATVLVFGMTGDSDALKLFDAMTAPVEVIDGKRTKRMNFDNTGGTRAFSIVCVLSGFIAESGTCTVILNAGPGTSIDKNASEAHFMSVDAGELALLTNAFVIPADSGLIYSSADSKLRLSVSRLDGAVQSFEILYR